MNRLEIGQQIETTVAGIGRDCIFLDLNTKSEGVLDITEVSDENGNVTVKEGERIAVYFVGEKRGEMTFTTRIDGSKADKTMLENAYKNGIPVDGVVEKEIKGGYEIKIGESRAFCPYSQMGFRQKEEPAFYIGKRLTFKIREYKENGRNILVSNRAIGEAEYRAHLDELKSTLKEGMTVTGTVESLQKYGAFVMVQGFKALLPVSEIARGRVNDIGSVLSVGQEVTAQIIKIDWQNERISLSLKALLADPWDTAEETYRVGSKHTGTISRVADFGVFVSLEEGIDGLVHVSRLTGIERNTNLRKVFSPGTKMEVTVLEVSAEDRRIALSPTSSNAEDTATRNYLGAQKDDGDTYNPFASLLKK